MPIGRDAHGDQSPPDFVYLGRLGDRQVYGAGKALGSFALSITVFLQVSMATPPMRLEASEVAGGKDCN